ncbi:SOSS complex subunit C isoform X1 [Xenopus laevis]|uniref:SOSS complex subunit C n=1 Tax=Xenopus laevis TaxID=8355 RepID=A0A8J1LIY2_XENLA|nr:SOSS complex subunit C isoform X1 [Xenopus laevis]OCT59290.1 hypothetical protein XELAEV_18001242mg [Xenopus laevis]
MFKQRSGTAACVKKIGTAMDPGSTASPLQCTAGFPSKNRVAILAELDKEKRKLLLQNQSSTNNPGASIALARPNMNKDFRDHSEQQHIAAQQKAALQWASHIIWQTCGIILGAVKTTLSPQDLQLDSASK